MSKLTAADALALPLPGRVQLVQDIWDTIAAAPNALPLSEDEKRLIDQRLEAYHRHPDAGVPWEDVLAEIASVGEVSRCHSARNETCRRLTQRRKGKEITGTHRIPASTVSGRHE